MWVMLIDPNPARLNGDRGFFLIRLPVYIADQVSQVKSRLDIGWVKLCHPL